MPLLSKLSTALVFAAAMFASHATSINSGEGALANASSPHGRGHVAYKHGHKAHAGRVACDGFETSEEGQSEFFFEGDGKCHPCAEGYVSCDSGTATNDPECKAAKWEECSTQAPCYYEDQSEC